MEFSKESSFKRFQLQNSPIYSVAVRIMAVDNDYSNVFASGTGVVIARNLILTAKHVFDDFAEKWKLPNADHKGAVETNTFQIWVLFISDDAKGLYHVYKVGEVYLCPYSDFALFRLVDFDMVGKNHQYAQSSLSLTLPSVGERVVAFGYPKSKVIVRRDHDGTAHIEVNDEPSVSVGEIKEVYPERRDSYMMPFPAALTNARLEGGMSGGPVFNDAGSLIGVVCSGYDLPDGEPISYVALLWPLMATPIIDKGRKFPLYDLAQKGIVHTEGLARIIIDPTDNENIYSIQYDRNVQPVKTLVTPNVGRNDPCPCGSGRKYKKCCIQ